MGQALCKEHGRQGIQLCCEHIATGCGWAHGPSASHPDDVVCVTVDVLDDGEHVLPYFMCGACARQYGWVDGAVLPGECYDEFSTRPRMVPVCYSCHARWSAPQGAG